MTDPNIPVLSRDSAALLGNYHDQISNLQGIDAAHIPQFIDARAKNLVEGFLLVNGADKLRAVLDHQDHFKIEGMDGRETLPQAVKAALIKQLAEQATGAAKIQRIQQMIKAANIALTAKGLDEAAKNGSFEKFLQENAGSTLEENREAAKYLSEVRELFVKAETGPADIQAALATAKQKAAEADQKQADALGSTVQPLTELAKLGFSADRVNNLLRSGNFAQAVTQALSAGHRDGPNAGEGFNAKETEAFNKAAADMIKNYTDSAIFPWKLREQIANTMSTEAISSVVVNTTASINSGIKRDGIRGGVMGMLGLGEAPSTGGFSMADLRRYMRGDRPDTIPGLKGFVVTDPDASAGGATITNPVHPRPTGGTSGPSQ
jgi:hypothetical protein